MEIDDPKAMAALLLTARGALKDQVQPRLDGEAKLAAAMVANAMALAARALAEPGTAWSARAAPPLGRLARGVAAAQARALRPHVAVRLAVTQPGYAERVAGAPV